MRRLFIPALAVSAVLSFAFFAQPVQAQTDRLMAPQNNLPNFEILAENLLPTVVNISTTTKLDINNDERADAPNLPQLPFPPGSPFEDFFKEFYDQFQNGQPLQPNRPDKISALGSGFIIDADKGYIVTNNHVIKDADEIKIILHDDTSLDATLVGMDEKTDLAVLKVKPTKSMVSASWGDSDGSKVGSWVLAIGNPFGLGGTVTAGIISARQRNINAGPYDDFIQTDASINRGNSGGPMFNTKGQVIGVNTAIFSPSGGSVGIGFAVPSNIAQNVVSQLIKYGKTKRGWLGVRIQEVTKEIADSLSMKKAEGALISSVTKDSPADKAGLQNGDVIISFNGTRVDSMRILPRLVAEAEINKLAKVTVWRDGQERQMHVTLGELEKAEEDGLTTQDPRKAPLEKDIPTTKIDELGLELSALNDTIRKMYSLEKDVQGVVVTGVVANSPADEKAMTKGDVILEVDQKDVASPQDIISRLKTAKDAKRSSVLFFIARGDDRRFVALKLPSK